MRGRTSTNQKIAEQFSRLFNPSDKPKNKTPTVVNDGPVGEYASERKLSDDNAKNLNTLVCKTNSTSSSYRNITTEEELFVLVRVVPCWVKIFLKRLSDSDMVTNNHHESSKANKKSIKDSKSCNDIKNSTSGVCNRAGDSLLLFVIEY